MNKGFQVTLVLCSSMLGGMMQADGHFSVGTVCKVQRRLYLIRRLEEPVAILEKVKEQGMHKSVSGSNVFYFNPDLCSLFHHPLLHAIAKAMVNTRSVDPFYRAWNDFLSYKFIEDVDFVRETIILLLLLYQKFLVGSAADEEATSLIHHIEEAVHRALYLRTGSLSEPVSLINKAAEWGKKVTSNNNEELTMLLAGSYTPAYICRDIECEDMRDNLTSLAHVLEENEQYSQNDVLIINNSMRFYHVQRLLYGMYLLSNHKEWIASTNNIFDPMRCDVYSHERIRSCAVEIQQTHCLFPLFKEWKQFISYGNIEDKKYTHDFILLIYVIFNILSHSDCSVYKKAEPREILLLYDSLATMPIAEMLELLDEVVDMFAQTSLAPKEHALEAGWYVGAKKIWLIMPRIMHSLSVIISYYNILMKKWYNYYFNGANDSNLSN